MLVGPNHRTKIIRLDAVLCLYAQSRNTFPNEQGRVKIRKGKAEWEKKRTMFQRDEMKNATKTKLERLGISTWTIKKERSGNRPGTKCTHIN